MRIAIPVVDTEDNRYSLAGGLNVNGYLYITDVGKNAGDFIKIKDLSVNLGDLLPALEKLFVKTIIIKQIHPMALKVLVNKGFTVYKAKGNKVDENILFFNEKQLNRYTYDEAMELANVCGDECTTCNTSTCDDKKYV
ncbi:conserved hypothetical protein [uncultured Paludibacter sp.]|nr:conserved hypothetical protein [uncultured Paludibacter sp.]